MYWCKFTTDDAAGLGSLRCSSVTRLQDRLLINQGFVNCVNSLPPPIRFWLPLIEGNLPGGGWIMLSTVCTGCSRLWTDRCWHLSSADMIWSEHSAYLQDKFDKCLEHFHCKCLCPTKRIDIDSWSWGSSKAEDSSRKHYCFMEIHIRQIATHNDELWSGIRWQRFL